MAAFTEQLSGPNTAGIRMEQPIPEFQSQIPAMAAEQVTDVLSGAMELLGSATETRETKPQSGVDYNAVVSANLPYILRGESQAIKESKRAVGELNQAVEQGRMSRSESAIRAWQIQQSLINADPGAGAEIADAFKEEIGFTPAARVMELQDEQFAEQQRMQNLLIDDAINSGLAVFNRDGTIDRLSTMQQAQQDKINQLNFDNNLGDSLNNRFATVLYNLRTPEAAESFMQSAPPEYREGLSTMAKMMQGQLPTGEDFLLAQSAWNTYKSRLRAQALAAPTRRSQAEINAAFDEWAAPYDAVFSDDAATATTLLQAQNEYFDVRAEAAFRENAPAFASMAVINSKSDGFLSMGIQEGLFEIKEVIEQNTDLLGFFSDTIGFSQNPPEDYGVSLDMAKEQAPARQKFVERSGRLLTAGQTDERIAQGFLANGAVQARTMARSGADSDLIKTIDMFNRFPEKTYQQAAQASPEHAEEMAKQFTALAGTHLDNITRGADIPDWVTLSYDSQKDQFSYRIAGEKRPQTTLVRSGVRLPPDSYSRLFARIDGPMQELINNLNKNRKLRQKINTLTESPGTGTDVLVPLLQNILGEKFVVDAALEEGQVDRNAQEDIE